MVETLQETPVDSPRSQRPWLKSHTRIVRKKKTSSSSSPSIPEDTEVFEDVEGWEDESLNLFNKEEEEVTILQAPKSKKNAVQLLKAFGTAMDVDKTALLTKKASFPPSGRGGGLSAGSKKKTLGCSTPKDNTILDGTNAPSPASSTVMMNTTNIHNKSQQTVLPSIPSQNDVKEI